MPEELLLSILQQGIGKEHETFIRILIQQKSSFEKIKEELLTYESTYRPEDKEVKVINEVNFVDALRAAFQGGDKKTAFGSSNSNSRFKSKWKNNQSSNTSQSNQSSQKSSSSKFSCPRCLENHLGKDCRNPIKCR